MRIFENNIQSLIYSLKLLIKHRLLGFICFSIPAQLVLSDNNIYFMKILFTTI